MRIEVSANRKNGGISDDDNLGVGRLKFTAECPAERKHLTALYFIDTPVLPRDPDFARRLAAVEHLEYWLRIERGRLNLAIAEAKKQQSTPSTKK
jgi:hypothetical protein